MDGLRWALNAMGRAAKAMHHSSTDIELCQSCCDAITSESAYPLAWIGFAVKDVKHSVEIVAKSGQGISYLDGTQITWADEANGRDTVGTAIRTGKTQIINNTLGAPAFVPWFERAAAAGFHSAIGIPLIDGSECFGVLAVYSNQPDAFDEDAVGCLENLANMIGFGVNLHHTTSAMLNERQKAIAINGEKLRTLQLLNTIADSSNDAIFAKDTEGRYLLFNREVARETGKPPEDVLGKRDDEIYPPEVAAGFIASDSSTMRLSHSVTFEEKFTTVNGERIFLTTKGTMRDRDGNVFGTFGIARDITERKRIENALIAREQELRTLLENSPDTIARYDLNCRRTYVNTALQCWHPNLPRLPSRFAPTASGYQSSAASSAARSRRART